MKLYIQASAEADILGQFEYYLEQELPGIAQHFNQSVRTSIEGLLTKSRAGAPKETANPKLSGLRTRPVDGFDEFRIYYILRDETLHVIRVLHGKRDIQPIIARQDVPDLNE